LRSSLVGSSCIAGWLEARSDPADLSGHAVARACAASCSSGTSGRIATFVIGQVGLVTLAMAWVWVAGLRFLWRSGRPLWRGMAWAYGLLLVLFTLTAGAKTYYLAAAYVYLLAAGAWPSTGGCKRGQAGSATPCWLPR
jgi:hypothetical protein